MSLKGKVILITGGVLGECTAALLAKEGGTIALSYNSKPPKGTFGEGFKAFQADLRTEAGVESLFKAVKQAYGRIDIAINNSGKVLKKAIGEITEKVSTVWRSFFSTSNPLCFFLYWLALYYRLLKHSLLNNVQVYCIS